MQETDFPFELVIGEDCSTDNTRKICEDYARRFPDKIRLLARERNLGMCSNFVETILACRGDFIAFCDGDDYWIDP
ncbi:glycosyltransferase, partial [Escherichia coli]|nr:glycosyltransferase [Escherichia coli]